MGVGTQTFPFPVVRPKKSVLKLVGEVLNHGGPAISNLPLPTLQRRLPIFAVFARSKFDPKARSSVTLQEARAVIDIAVKNHIGYLLSWVASRWCIASCVP